MSKVGQDIENLDFNTAISALMILVNEFYKEDCLSKSALEKLILLLTPFAPHLCEEVWQAMGQKSFVSLAPWPSHDANLIKEDTASIAVQVNGKKRGVIEVSKETSQDQALDMAKEIEAVNNAIGEASIRKVIYVPGKILNLIAK